MSAVLNRNDMRKKRIRFLKRCILLITAGAIIFPIVFTFVLLNKVDKLESQISELYQLQMDSSQKETITENIDKNNADGLDGMKSQIVEEVVPEALAEIDNRKVYLTFDDGPSENTARILDILKEYNVKATFFVIGKEDEQSKALYRRIVEEGHTLGMHSYSHNYKEIYSSGENYRLDLMKLKSYLFEVTGVECSYVRFPGGSSNKVSTVDMQELINYLNENELTYFDWNLSIKDADRSNLPASQITDNCLSQIEDYSKEVIILFHDAPDKDTTVEALGDIIKGINVLDNTQILPITEETLPVQHVKGNSIVQ